ncbi:hypothetical protein CQA53_11060, partial [Helicobacter didelphidarum]
MQNLHQNGIITMDIDGWRDAGGHTTLWNGAIKQFEDSILNQTN